jgi:hypothetical protein
VGLSVVGAGFGRTATLSVKFALEQLGLGPCYHMKEVFERPHFRKYWGAAARGETVNWDEVFEGYVSAVDWPVCTYYRELAEHFPDAKVLLTVRDPRKWFVSAHTTIFSAENRARMLSADADDDTRDMGSLIMVDTFDGQLENEEHAISVFEKHIETVKRTIPEERLLVYDASEGWEPLCAFLDVPVPDGPFPRVNTSQEFRERWTRPSEGA